MNNIKGIDLPIFMLEQLHFYMFTHPIKSAAGEKTSIQTSTFNVLRDRNTNEYMKVNV